MERTLKSHDYLNFTNDRIVGASIKDGKFESMI